MRFELIRQKFDGNVSYKIFNTVWCCDELSHNPAITLTDEYDLDDSQISDPVVAIKSKSQCTDDHDRFEVTDYYKINFCPFCGEPVTVTVISEEDVSDDYFRLKKIRKDYWKRAQGADSKKLEKKLLEKVKRLDKEIERLYEIGEYRKTEDEAHERE